MVKLTQRCTGTSVVANAGSVGDGVVLIEAVGGPAVYTLAVGLTLVIILGIYRLRRQLGPAGLRGFQLPHASTRKT